VSAALGNCDVAVLGAGAAGLVAAARAAQRGRSVVLLEKGRRPGVKILMSGGTRCNITNARGLRRLEGPSGPIDPDFDPRLCRGPRAIEAAFAPAAGRFLAPALRTFSVEDTLALFEGQGVATKVEANGKIFPVSDRAVDVLDALLRVLAASGARLLTSTPATALMPSDGGFAIDTPAGPLEARAVILAVGGQSYPGCGTTGDGYAFARELGHTIVPTRPALVPIRVDAPWVAGLRGVTIPDTHLRVRDPAGTVLLERRESLLFAHFGLTGPAPLDVSRAIAVAADPASLRLEVDWLPADRREAIDARLQAEARHGRPAVASLLPLPRRLADALLGVAGIPADRVGPELTRDERRRLLDAAKALPLRIAGTLGFEKAEVTTGGIALDEVDPRSLQSRIQPGLFLCGEVLDLDGRIGGYNFQAAWSTGWLAGNSV
jgi:predicted Rossmann fold flavoprotein